MYRSHGHGDPSESYLTPLTDDLMADLRGDAHNFGIDATSYVTTSEDWKDDFGYPHIPPLLLSFDDEGEFMNEIISVQKEAQGMKHDYDKYMMENWSSLLATKEPPTVSIAFKPETNWSTKQIDTKVDAFRFWLVKYNLLIDAYNFVRDTTRITNARAYHKINKNAYNGINPFWLEPHNIILFRAMVSRTISEHLNDVKDMSYWSAM